MALHPTHRKRTPYLFHFHGQTVAMGEPTFLFDINEILLKAGVSTRPTFWDQTYFADVDGESRQLIGSGAEDFGTANDKSMLNSVGVSLDREAFWDAIQKGIFASAQWPSDDEALFLPEIPDFLQKARSWEFDPILPADGPGDMGGWDRIDGRAGTGQPIGLFQLTAPDSFWVLGSAEDLEGLFAFCKELAQFRLGFDKTTGFIGSEGRYTCLALPIECRGALEEELWNAGVDTESLFWE